MTLILLVALSANGQQGALTRFIDPAIYNGINPFEYQKIKFSWNMATDVQIAMNEGLTAMDQEQYVQAALHFDRVLTLDNAFGPAWYYRSICYKNTLNLHEAEFDMMKALNLLNMPECSIELGDIFYIRGDFDLASKYYGQATKADPTSVNAYYKKGCLFVNTLKLDEGIKSLEKCLTLDPRFVKAHLQLGLIEFRFKKNYTAANQSFSKVIDYDSTNAEAYFGRGLVYIINREKERCLAEFNKAVSFAPQNWYYRLMRGYLYFDQNDIEHAFTDLKNALMTRQVHEGKSQFDQTLLDKRIDLQNATEYLNRVMYGYDDLSLEFLKLGYCHLLSGTYHSAIENFDRMIRMNESACAMYLKALAYEHMKKHGLALEAYSKALQFDPDIFDAHKKRAIYRTELKDWDGAFADLAEMRRLQPGSQVTNRLSGFLKYNHQDYAGAIKDMDVYLKFDSTDVEAFKIRADSKSKLKDFSGAIQDFVRVKKLSEGRTDINELIALEKLIINTSLQAGDTATAIDQLIVADKKYNLLEFQIQLAEVYIESRKFELTEKYLHELEKYFTNGLMMSNNIMFVHYLRSKLKAKQGRYSEALRQINRGLKMTNSLDFLFQRAKVYISLNQIEDARKDLEVLIKSDYKKAEKLYALYNTP